MLRRLLPALILLLSARPALAAETTGFLDRTYTTANGVEVKYVVFVPKNYDKAKPTPTILFLHGAGEAGTDNKAQLNVGLGKAVKAREATFPFIVVFPQAQKKERLLLQTWLPGHTEGDRAIVILETVAKEFSVDPKRTYLSGISMGGFGTWGLANKSPKRWAAIVPVCGGGNPDWGANLKDTPTWCFHGASDSLVPVAGSRVMIESMKKAGGKPNYDEYPGVDHNSWDKAYSTEPLYLWLQKQSLK